MKLLSSSLFQSITRFIWLIINDDKRWRYSGKSENTDLALDPEW